MVHCRGAFVHQSQRCQKARVNTCYKQVYCCSSQSWKDGNKYLKSSRHPPPTHPPPSCWPKSWGRPRWPGAEIMRLLNSFLTRSSSNGGKLYNFQEKEGWCLTCLESRKELRSFCQDPGFTIAHNTTYWTDLFVRHFLFQVSNQCHLIFSLSPSVFVQSSPPAADDIVFKKNLLQADTAIDSDDLLFFVRKRQAIYILHLYDYQEKILTNILVLLCLNKKVWNNI